VQMRLNHAAAEGEAGLPPAALLGGASRLHAVDQVRPFPRPLARFRLSPESHLARHRPTHGRSPHVSALVSVSGSRCRLPRASRARRAGTTPACLFGARLASIYSPLQDRHWQSQSPQSRTARLCSVRGGFRVLAIGVAPSGAAAARRSGEPFVELGRGPPPLTPHDGGLEPVEGRGWPR
jgi:hypothetical protein